MTMAQTNAFKRSALVPKSECRLLSRPPAGHELAFARLAPPERKAMREIVESADLMLVDGRPFLLAPVTDATIETLAAFKAAREEIEDGDEDCCDGQDDRVSQSIHGTGV